MTEIKIKSNGTKRTCPECKGQNVKARSKTNDYRCQTCGCIFEVLSEVPE